MRILLIVTALLALAACGGGEKSAMVGQNPSPENDLESSTKLPLNSQNAQEIVNATLAARSSVLEAGNSNFAVNFNAPTGVNKTVNLAGVATKTVTTIAPASASAYEQTHACEQAGFISITPQMANPEQGFAPGDYVIALFNNCVARDNTSLHGEITLIFSDIEGNMFSSSAFMYTADMEFEELQVADTTGFRVTINGDISVTQETSDDATSVEISSSRITISGSQNLSLETLFSADVAYLGTSSYTSESNGRLTDHSLGGEVEFVTSQEFEGFLGEYPSTGTMDIVGANSSKIRLTALDAQRVSIAVDADGDGQFEDSNELPWEALSGAMINNSSLSSLP